MDDAVYGPNVREEYELPPSPDTSHLITEDDTPVDNLFSEKQQRLLTEPLYSSWSGPREGIPFLVAANVAVYAAVARPPVVPGVFLSLDVRVIEDWWSKGGRSYLIWEYGKAPDLVIEIVSNDEGGETTRKLEEYSRIGVPYYVIFDPEKIVQATELMVYELRGRSYVPIEYRWLELVQLGLTIWEDTYEFRHARWLRWIDREGNLIPTGRERAERERQRAERLAAQLRAAGIEPEE